MSDDTLVFFSALILGVFSFFKATKALKVESLFQNVYVAGLGIFVFVTLIYSALLEIKSYIIGWF